MLRRFLSKNKAVLGYGLSLAVLLFILKWLELRFVIYDHAMELYVGAIALMFTLLGIWLARKLTRPQKETIIVEKTVYPDSSLGFVPDETEIAHLGISKRELEVLELMARGLSNEEIGNRLFVSLNTIKTHSSRIFEKLDVSRRTQAVEKAKRLRLIP